MGNLGNWFYGVALGWDWIVVSGEDWRIFGTHAGKKSKLFILGLEEQGHLLCLYMRL